jgi:cell division protein FtsQ
MAARSAAATLPRKRARPRVKPRALAAIVAVPVVAVGAYFLARETSTFSIRSVSVSGGSPALQAQVRSALAPVLGKSLLAFDGAAIVRRLDALPAVVSARYDRAFPHTLRITVVPERPVGVVRRGTESWLVSARGRAIVQLRPRRRLGLPRIWVPTAVHIAAGDFLEPDAGGIAASVLSVATGFPARVTTVVFAHGEVTLRLRSGVEIRLGEPVDVRLKLAVARRALRVLPPEATYVDVAVPQRPVAGADPQLSGKG